MWHPNLFHMTPIQIAEILALAFPTQISRSVALDKHPRIETTGEYWRDIAAFLRHDERLEFDWLASLSAIDYAANQKLAVAYDFYSTSRLHRFAVKVFTARDEARIPSVMDIWPAADWHEREAYDLMGITFPGHANLTRILLPDDWVGHPLRKDYVYPTEYQGIPGTYGPDWHKNPVIAKK